MAVSNGKVTIRGTLRVPAASVDARVNRGRFESRECTPDDRTLLPEVKFTCHVDPSDALARIEVSSYPPDRILGHSIAGLLVAPSGEKLTSTWHRAAHKPVDAQTPLADGFLAALNGVRRDAGLREVTAAKAQSEIASRVVPHFFAPQGSTKEARDALADAIALGMLAGWSVEGTVHDGMLAADGTSDTGDPARLIASMLESPSARSVLLDPDADVIAIGALRQPERGFLGALVTVYRLFEHVPPEARIQKVVARMDALRAERGQPPATVLQDESRRKRPGSQPGARPVAGSRAGEESKEHAWLCRRDARPRRLPASSGLRRSGDPPGRRRRRVSPAGG
jgi:hypothetical protein